AALMRKTEEEKKGGAKKEMKRKTRKKKKKKKRRRPPANAFTLFAKGFFEDLVAKSIAKGMNPKEDRMRQELVLKCDRAWAALDKDAKRQFVLAAAAMNRIEDEEMLAEAFAGSGEDGELGGGIEWEGTTDGDEGEGGEDGEGGQEEISMKLGEAINFAEGVARMHEDKEEDDEEEDEKEDEDEEDEGEEDKEEDEKEDEVDVEDEEAEDGEVQSSIAVGRMNASVSRSESGDADAGDIMCDDESFDVV
ncbi:hypothetical protein TrRE_jg3814, partial [Triparma retinervis]